MPLALLPFILLVIPILEISVFVLVGSRIGLLPTLGLILFTALLGATLLRWQGFQVIGRIKAELDGGRLPGRALGDGAMVLVAGVLLLTPGFVTDTIGFLLFVPAIRAAIWNGLARHVTVVFAGGGPTSARTRGGGWAGRAGSGARPAGRPDNRVIDLDPEEFESHDGRHGPQRRDDRNPQ